MRLDRWLDHRRTPGCLALVAAALLVLAADPALSTVPAGWNGGLVIFAHGYRGTEYFAGVPLLDAMGRPDLLVRISARWLPVLGQPDSYTAEGRRFDSVIKYLFGGTLAAGTSHLLVQRAVRWGGHCGFEGVREQGMPVVCETFKVVYPTCD